MHRVDDARAARPGWLEALHKAQAIMDKGVRLALAGESQLRALAPACGRGCSGCCASRQPLATEIEAAGALRHLERAGARGAIGRFLSSGQEQGCPFLEGGLCAAYPMRPLSCRQTLVFGRACLPGEDPRRTRPGDMLTPLRGHAERAYSLLLAHREERTGHGPSTRQEFASPRAFLRPLSALDRSLVLELAGQALSGSRAA